jgi:transcriptional regulator CtsR
MNTNLSFLEIKDTTQNISDLMKKVQKSVARDIFKILVHQLRDQAFMIDTNQSEALGESCLSDLNIFGKKFDMDFLISTPNNLIEESERNIIKLI